MQNSILDIINKNSIVGEDFKYNDLFLLIEQEIDKRHSATFDGSTDWEFVLNQSYEILSTKSKDLKIATWWLYSIWKNESFSGLEKNIDFYIRFIETFNTNLYPKSKKAKENIVLWFEETITDELLQKDFELYVNNINFLKYLNQLNNAYNNVLDNNVQYFKKLIKKLTIKIEEEKSKEQLLEKIVDSTSNNITTNDDINDSNIALNLTNLKKLASNISIFNRSKNEFDLKAIKITRFLSWLEVDELPVNENLVTPLNPPSVIEVDELRQLFNESKFKEAFILCEEIIEMCPFWLDGHYYSFKILNNLNEIYLANEVKNQFIAYIKTNEGLVNLYFNDNIPFASSKTKSWINKQLQNIVAQNSDQNDDEFDIDEITDLKEAMKEIEKRYRDTNNYKDKFLLRVKHLEIAINFNKDEISLAIFDELEKYIKKYNLIEWNPAIVSKVYFLILSSFNSVQIKREKIEKMYSILCKIDIDKALKLNI
ncbi:TssA family type VI secretion system protein [Arcobacter sp. CECT 8985]|uniref:TssA family type VI secretion system protein n=1 Tax=Arcobacter sp. CECT 8985 TaxID=1935424 RepID=UPI00100BD5DE|nr:TssA family type VI secretion system protein [Arcobacter sp. CECT 8985]RXJ87616.1 hypothetical protein CRU93_03540 [Arcobacter sp. CECT 8985]